MASAHAAVDEPGLGTGANVTLVGEIKQKGLSQPLRRRKRYQAHDSQCKGLQRAGLASLQRC
jgi:hypothetical protein